MIKAIETTYKGYRFRSRLEARWAAFFDYLNVRYEYENYSFDLDGVWYIPDFYLPDYDVFFEVKGVMSDNDREKCTRLAKEKTLFVFGDISSHGLNGEMLSLCTQGHLIFTLGNERYSQCYHKPSKKTLQKAIEYARSMRFEKNKSLLSLVKSIFNK